MAAVKSNTNPAKACNFVGQDQIWKDHVQMEMQAANAWPSTWGFIAQAYKEMVEDDMQMRKSRVKVDLPPHMQTRVPSPPEKYIKVDSSPKLPQTTQGFIGWRSAVPSLGLERFGKVHKGRTSFLKELKWPAEASDS
ncbi:hypothetical protein AOXY_G26509 [Acipenser oxyrinchus oxyrinchus]|uniref:Uncharacterized protein n=1 Tax=Acipenser oxyrinchus oxyrinchus TaxID=40147 RepID=A0AAD8CT79_ACIOX|nr:hypothetical protein AOXY_G26509 [Acipenser oxyrinchus oxyrinchus]